MTSPLTEAADLVLAAHPPGCPHRAEAEEFASRLRESHPRCLKALAAAEAWLKQEVAVP